MSDLYPVHSAPVSATETQPDPKPFGVASNAASTLGSTPGAPIPFRFTGTGSEYFRIWIVNWLLTLLTLGIYSAWAKVRRIQFFTATPSWRARVLSITVTLRRFLKDGLSLLFFSLVSSLPVKACRLLRLSCWSCGR